MQTLSCPYPYPSTWLKLWHRMGTQSLEKIVKISIPTRPYFRNTVPWIMGLVEKGLTKLLSTSEVHILILQECSRQDSDQLEDLHSHAKSLQSCLTLCDPMDL